MVFNVKDFSKFKALPQEIQEKSEERQVRNSFLRRQSAGNESTLKKNEQSNISVTNCATNIDPTPEKIRNHHLPKSYNTSPICFRKRGDKFLSDSVQIEASQKFISMNNNNKTTSRDSSIDKATETSQQKNTIFLQKSQEKIKLTNPMAKTLYHKLFNNPKKNFTDCKGYSKLDVLAKQLLANSGFKNNNIFTKNLQDWKEYFNNIPIPETSNNSNFYNKHKVSEKQSNFLESQILQEISSDNKNHLYNNFARNQPIVIKRNYNCTGSNFSRKVSKESLFIGDRPITNKKGEGNEFSLENSKKSLDSILNHKKRHVPDTDLLNVYSIDK